MVTLHFSEDDYQLFHHYWTMDARKKNERAIVNRPDKFANLW